MDYYSRIQNAIEFIELNLNEDISITDIASKAFFSVFHFQRLFQAISGFSVKGYIRKRRMTEAAILLKAMDFNQKVNMVTTGYFLAEEYWGRGIASEAVGILIKFLFETININRIKAEVMLKNMASKKVLMKNGFTKEGLVRQGSLWPGKGIVDLEMYSILRGDYNR